MLDGKIYSIPALASVPSTLIFYSKQLFKDAGLDPENPPKTYGEFRKAAKKIILFDHHRIPVSSAIFCRRDRRGSERLNVSTKLRNYQTSKAGKLQ